MSTAAAPPRPPLASSRTPSARPPPAPKPPLTLHHTAHIGESITLTGTHPITIGAYAILHPRVTLNSLHGPIYIGEGVIIGAKTVVGLTSPLPATASSEAEDDDDDGDGEGNKAGVRIEKDVTIGPSSHISASRIGPATAIEAQVSLPALLRVGAHSRICAGVSIPEGAEDVGDWVVVGGFGARRTRRVGGIGIGNGQGAVGGDGDGEGEGKSGAEVMEEARLKGLERERIMLRGLLKRNVKV